MVGDTMNKKFNGLMQEVLANLDMSGMESTESGAYIITVDDKVAINIGCPNDDVVFFFCSIAELGEDNALQKMNELLRFNAMTTEWAPVMHLSSDNKIILWGKERLDTLGQIEFLTLFESFIDFALEAYQWANADSGSLDSASPEHDESESPLWMSHQVIRA
ncbi:CesT family type III secretion system chaperone [Halodesulfovibrio marinisediminis]|uniref:Tir chaperone protein (CesT) family protein n=1 Tax=Halodesulfovibrio marinisediminis DSM 17456 TaxID=1121457 RepID=A0A1N6I8C3_9BACT|nr:CesT family type III secretion system chaperone [Halodesulfovibrio marinisediminis]SIO28267.1 Tir chaperone protein (CesT) family protein [Halodesulfovibrio marinisediminis DSM 17456]